MNEVVADAVQQSQVDTLPVGMLAVGLMAVARVLHRAVQSAGRAPSALGLEELPAGCIQPAVLSSSCAPVAPVAIIRAHACAPRCLVCDGGLPRPLQGLGFPRAPRVPARADGCAGLVHDPVGVVMGVWAFCPAIELLPPPGVSPVQGVCTPCCLAVIAPSDHLWVAHVYSCVWGGGLHPFSDRCQDLRVPFSAVFAGVYDGLLSLLCLILSDWELSTGKAKEVATHVAVACLLCCKGVGTPCFCVLAFSPPACEPCLESLCASLYAFPWVMEDDQVVGISETVCAVGELLAVHRMCSWSTGVLHSVFEAVQRTVGAEG